MKQVERLMERIVKVMEKTPYAHEFEQLSLDCDEKKTFLWLDEKWRNGDLPIEFEPLLKDLFFMLH